MELTITPYKAGERKDPFLPDNGIYEALGEDGIRKMISEFYDLLIQSEIKDMFHEDKEAFELSKQYAADFIIQRFGGPAYYRQRRGAPKLMNRHAPFKITPEARIVWLECYREAILNQPVSKKIMLDYWQYIDEFSIWMVNSPGKTPKFGALKPEM